MASEFRKMCFRTFIFAAPKIWCFFKRQRHETYPDPRDRRKMWSFEHLHVREMLSTNGNDEGGRFRADSSGRRKFRS